MRAKNSKASKLFFANFFSANTDNQKQF